MDIKTQGTWNRIFKIKQNCPSNRRRIWNSIIFYIKKLGIVIEIDGVSHNEKLEEDEIRDNYLKSLGLTVIRYSDLDVKHNLDNVIQDLKNQIITNLVDM